MTTGDNPQQFLLYDNGTDATERILIFSTNEHLELLGRSDTLFMDGTFGVCPSLFQQLYVVHGQVGTSHCPLLYALMERQTQSSYEELFNFIVDNSAAKPTFINVDFEIAVHQAIRSVFGNTVTIRGCFYHLTQSTWRKIQSLGLTDQYREDEEFRLYCGQLDALAFLPVDRVEEGMAFIRRTMPPAAVDLVNYFDETYVSGPLKKRPLQNGTLRLRLRRLNPAFPPTVWNCHAATLINDARTNNVCEGYNNCLAYLVGQKHPSVWKLIETLQMEAARVHVLVIQDARGMRHAKRIFRTYEKLQKCLHNLCDDLISNRKDLPQFLRGISHNIRFGQPAS